LNYDLGDIILGSQSEKRPGEPLIEIRPGKFLGEPNGLGFVRPEGLSTAPLPTVINYCAYGL